MLKLESIYRVIPEMKPTNLQMIKLKSESKFIIPRDLDRLDSIVIRKR